MVIRSGQMGWGHQCQSANVAVARQLAHLGFASRTNVPAHSEFGVAIVDSMSINAYEHIFSFPTTRKSWDGPLSVVEETPWWLGWMYSCWAALLAVARLQTANPCNAPHSTQRHRSPLLTRITIDKSALLPQDPQCWLAPSPSWGDQSSRECLMDRMSSMSQTLATLPLIRGLAHPTCLLGPVVVSFVMRALHLSRCSFSISMLWCDLWGCHWVLSISLQYRLE